VTRKRFVEGSGISRRNLLGAGAATLGAATAGAASFPLPAIAQTKPFAGVTLHGAAFQQYLYRIISLAGLLSRSRNPCST
jgi:multiple sugar transport system substrate-binding protein